MDNTDDNDDDHHDDGDHNKVEKHILHSRNNVNKAAYLMMHY